MIIDPIDLKIIRQLELYGSVSIPDLIGKFHITKKEILLRIKNFEDCKFIDGYGLKLFIPRIVGGRWYWGAIALQTDHNFRVKKSIPLLEEIVENLAFPKGVCPDLSLIFYTQNLKDAYKIINKTPGVKYAEVYKIGSYNIQVKKVLLKEDWRLISELYERLPELSYNDINRLLNAPKDEAEIKLARLVWTGKHKKGIIAIFPNFDWSAVQNYLHLHIAVTSKIRIRELRKIVNRLGCCGNITARFKKRFIQLEFDLWGFAEMQTILSSLKDIKKITVEGYSLAYKNKIYNDWFKDYLAQKI